MLPHDDVTFKEQIHPFCIDCGSRDIEADEDPFYGGPLFLVAPMKCKDCGYTFSLHFEIYPEAVIER